MRITGLWLSRLFLICLVFCLVTGLALAFQYRPLGDVFRTVEEYTTLAPYGMFLRRVHYWSGQACAVLALAHVLRYLVGGAYRRYGFLAWMRLVGAMAVCFALAFTGFLLKGDAESLSAASVFRNLILTIPWVGEPLAGMVIRPGPERMLLPYVYHCLVLPVGLICLLRGHVRRWLPGSVPSGWAMAAVGCVFVFLPLPVAVPPGSVHVLAHGPWFLAGLQELLRYGPPLLVGVVFPLAVAGVLCGLPTMPDRLARRARCLVLSSGAVYAGCSLLALFSAGG